MQSENAPAEINKARQIAKFILQVSVENNDNGVDIKLTDDLLIIQLGDPINDNVDNTYPSLLEHFVNSSLDLNYIINRAILASTNDIVNEIK